MESQERALIKRKRLYFLWFLWLTEVITVEKNLLMPQQQLGCHGPGRSVQDSSAQFAAGGVMGKDLSSLPREDVPHKCGIRAGSSQTLRQCLLRTSEIVTQMFAVQEQQPSDSPPRSV